MEVFRRLDVERSLLVARRLPVSESLLEIAERVAHRLDRIRTQLKSHPVFLSITHRHGRLRPAVHGLTRDAGPCGAAPAEGARPDQIRDRTDRLAIDVMGSSLRRRGEERKLGSAAWTYSPGVAQRSMAPRKPIRREMALAASSTAARQRGSTALARLIGATTLIAATTAPPSSRIGAATDAAPNSASSTFCAQPRSATRRSSASRSAGSTIVLDVRRSGRQSSSRACSM